MISGCLTVIGIVRVREAAARIQCVSNLKLIGLSVSNYADANNKLPPAAMPNPALPTERRLELAGPNHALYRGE